MFRVATAAVLVGWLAVAGLAIGVGTYMCWDALFARPNLYAHLRKDGVRAEAHLVDCRGPSLPPGPALRCQLSLTFRMQTRTWHYTGGPASQFTGIDINRIPMLVDP